MAHVLARYAKDVIEDIVWLEDTPPPNIEEFYHDSFNLNN